MSGPDVSSEPGFYTPTGIRVFARPADWRAAIAAFEACAEQVRAIAEASGDRKLRRLSEGAYALGELAVKWRGIQKGNHHGP